jgi:twinkle protein
MSEAHGSVVDTEPCPKCNSCDNVKRYEDGYAKCFGMGCTFYEMPDGHTPSNKPKGRAMSNMIEDWECVSLSKRCIGEKTTSKWKYGVADFKGSKVQVANYFRGGTLTAQKVRFPNKDFTILGDAKNIGLYGQHLWRDGGKYLCIVEGEIDALSVSQMFNNKYPVVSVPNGAQGAARSIKKELEWVEGFDNVVLMFDMDEPGQEAAKEVAGLLTPGKAKIARLPLKDPNEMLKAQRGGELVEAFWGAKPWRPDGIISIADIKDEVMKPTVMGVPYPWDTLTNAMFGRHDGQVIAVGAGTGVGKTDLFTQMIAFDAVELDIKCGILYLEQPPVETVKRVAGKIAGKKFHLPDGSWSNEELIDAMDKLDTHGNIVLYNHFGTSDWDIIQSRIRYMVVSLGCKHIYLDHLTALAAHAEDERKEIESLMADIAGMAQELGIVFHFVSHLATPEGKPHEEGGRVMIRHFKGSRAIGFWSHVMIGLERNQQASDPIEARTTTLRCLKDRYAQGTGVTLDLLYDLDTGILNPAPPKKADCPFDDDEEEF